ncbi:MAG: hypothetical protein GY805_11210, partial [Chloroflexi bacterium]|nr:hypothetical protein [Chloroflexota bacterium]
KKKSYTDISRSSGLSESLLQAIEIGLIPSDKIKNEWIKNLAYALVENQDRLLRLLGRPVTEDENTEPTDEDVNDPNTAIFFIAPNGVVVADKATCYWGAGNNKYGRGKYRSYCREVRDLDRQFFDK